MHFEYPTLSLANQRKVAAPENTIQQQVPGEFTMPLRKDAHIQSKEDNRRPSHLR